MNPIEKYDKPHVYTPARVRDSSVKPTAQRSGARTCSVWPDPQGERPRHGHLGNVHTVFSDRRNRNCTGTTLNHYEADILNTYDYYAFGMTMPGRNFEAQVCSSYTSLDSVFVANEDFATLTTGDLDMTNGFDFSANVLSYAVTSQRMSMTSNIRFASCAKYFSTVPGQTYSARLHMDLGTTTQTDIGIRYRVAGVVYVAASTLCYSTGYYTLSFTAPAGVTEMWIQCQNRSLSGPTVTFYLDNIKVWNMQNVTHTDCVATDAKGYRFGFNGMEKVNEFYGDANAYDFGARIYDPRIAKWLAVDPLYKDYPSSSPYCFAINNPLLFIDSDGRSIIIGNVDDQKALLETLRYMFGDKHGFEFNKENGMLFSNNGATPPAGLDKDKALMYNYFYKALVEPSGVTTLYTNKSMEFAVIGEEPNGLIKQRLFTTPNNTTATTIGINGYIKKGKYEDEYVPSKNIILVPPLVMKNGTTVAVSGAVDPSNLNNIKLTSDKPYQYVIMHELGHAIINIIKKELGGKLGDVDFTKMNDKQLDDWAIRFTNTFNRSEGNSQETGAGQHGRKENAIPSNSQDVAPLNK